MTHEILRWDNKIDHMIDIEEILPTSLLCLLSHVMAPQ